MLTVCRPLHVHLWISAVALPVPGTHTYIARQPVVAITNTPLHDSHSYIPKCEWLQTESSLY